MTILVKITTRVGRNGLENIKAEAEDQIGDQTQLYPRHINTSATFAERWDIDHLSVKTASHQPATTPHVFQPRQDSMVEEQAKTRHQIQVSP